jgi:hypothetical protein
LHPNEGGNNLNTSSLDRIDSTKGYVKGNIQVLSHKANTMKNSASPKQLLRFANWIIYIYGGQHEENSAE